MVLGNDIGGIESDDRRARYYHTVEVSSWASEPDGHTLQSYGALRVTIAPDRGEGQC